MEKHFFGGGADVAAGYVGPVGFSSPTDPAASLPGLDENGKPGQITFAPSDRGVKRLFYSLAFSAPGTQTLTVRETGGGNRIAEGSISVVVTGQAQETRGNRMEILSPKDGDTVKLTQSAVVLEKLIGQFLYNKAAEGGSK